MLALVLLTAHAGIQHCTFRGLPVELGWDDAGTLQLKDGADVLASVPLDLPAGQTSARCLPEGVRFLTDTREAHGKLTLATRTVSFTDLLDTLDPARFTRNQQREEEALSCTRTSIWEDYGEGWRVRSLTADVLSPGRDQVLQLALLPATTYRVSACVDGSAGQVQVELYDGDGRLVLAGAQGSRKKSLEHHSEAAGSAFVVVRHDGASEAGVSVAVGYR